MWAAVVACLEAGRAYVWGCGRRGMIRRLVLQDVGPSRRLAFELGSRFNVLTGDNGLGKTFVLDVVWWVLTATWAGEKAFPWRPLVEKEDGALLPEILVHLGEEAGALVELGGDWRWESQLWVRRPPRRLAAEGAPAEATDIPLPGLVIYARTDGSYAVWDAFWGQGAERLADAAILLTGSELWDGKEAPDATVASGHRTVIAGLIADWVGWQRRAHALEFEALLQVLRALSSPGEPLVPGEPTRVHLRDRRDIPTLMTASGRVPVTLASAGVRRVLALAYLLVWSWTEHLQAARQSRRSPTRELVLLIDEPELHLHPSWQRVVLPAALRALALLAPEVRVQVLTATHAPLVLASLETLFDEARDTLFVLERSGQLVQATPRRWGKEGDVSNWLASEVFGGIGGRSFEAELAVTAAMDFMAGRTTEAERGLQALQTRLAELPEGGAALGLTAPHRPLIERVHDALSNTLGGGDDFWVQWVLTWETGRTTHRRRP